MEKFDIFRFFFEIMIFPTLEGNFFQYTQNQSIFPTLTLKQTKFANKIVLQKIAYFFWVEVLSRAEPGCASLLRHLKVFFPLLHDFSNTPHWVLSILKDSNWHIQWNENLALELSYDLGLGCSPLFSNSTDYDSSYPWIRLRFVHLMGVRPVQTYCWKTNVSISLPSPTSDNAINMSIGYLPQKKYTNLNLFQH